MALASLPDAARTYRIPARTLRHWITTGRLVEHRHGRRYLVNPAEIEQLLTQRNAQGRLPRSA